MPSEKSAASKSGRRRRAKNAAVAVPAQPVQAAPADPAEPAAKRGRPSKYTSALGARIALELSNGRSLRSICRDDPDMPDERTVRAWALDAEHPFSPQYDRARTIGYHSMADEVVEIADDGINDYVLKKKADGDTFIAFDRDHVLRSRLRVDTRKWVIAKMLPKVYGDKLQHTGDGGGEIKTTVQLSANDELLSRIARIASRGPTGASAK